MGYVFTPERLHAIARGAVGLPHGAMCEQVIAELHRQWPSHVETQQEWIFNLAGGATGIMTVVHGSLSEYVLIFGSPVGTEAFSGRYLLEIHDFVLSGEMWTYTERDYAKRAVYQPGDAALLERGQSKGFRIMEDTWLLEYGRGPVPTALPVGLGDAIFSGMDPVTLWKTLRIYGRLTIKSLLQGKI